MRCERAPSKRSRPCSRNLGSGSRQRHEAAASVEPHRDRTTREAIRPRDAGAHQRGSRSAAAYRRRRDQGAGQRAASRRRRRTSRSWCDLRVPATISRPRRWSRDGRSSARSTIPIDYVGPGTGYRVSEARRGEIGRSATSSTREEVLRAEAVHKAAESKRVSYRTLGPAAAGNDRQRS